MTTALVPTTAGPGLTPDCRCGNSRPIPLRASLRSHNPSGANVMNPGFMTFELNVQVHARRAQPVAP